MSSVLKSSENEAVTTARHKMGYDSKVGGSGRTGFILKFVKPDIDTTSDAAIVATPARPSTMCGNWTKWLWRGR